MDKRKEKYADMKELHELSIGDLVAVYDSKEEADRHTRQQFFKDMQSEVAFLYRNLNTSGRRIINGLIDKLTNSDEHQGFNLNVFLYWMELSGVTIVDLATHFRDANVEDVIYSADDINSEIQREKLKAREIKRRIEYFFGSKEYRERSKSGRSGLTYIKALVNCLLFEPELIIDGHGKMEWVKDEILKEYVQSEFSEGARDEETGVLQVPIREELEDYSAYLGKSWDEIVDVKYLVINYTYGYRFLEESKDQSKKAIVDYLIQQLYSQQLEYEKELQSAYKGTYEAIAKFGGIQDNA